MPLQHSLFTLMNFVILLVVLLIDRKNFKNYVFLGIFGLAAAFIFETATTALGFWYYHSLPKIGIISFYTWLLYVPYLSFCYFIGVRFGASQVKSDE